MEQNDECVWDAHTNKRLLASYVVAGVKVDDGRK